MRSALSSRSCSVLVRKMPSLWLAVACTLCVLAGKPATAYADVDLFQNVRQFNFHQYTNSDSEQQYGSSKYWEVMEFTEQNGTCFLENQSGTGVNNRQRFQVNSQFQTYMTNCICVKSGERLNSGNEIDVCVTSKMFKKGYKVLPIWSGYVLGSERTAHTQTSGNLTNTYYIEEFRYRYYPLLESGDQIRWYGANSENGLVRLQAGADGTVTLDHDYAWIILRIKVNYSGTVPSSVSYISISKPQLILLTDDLAISSQTETLMDTTGADSVGSQQVTDAQSMVENMSMLNVIEEVDGAYHTAIATTDEQSTLTFPGISLPIAGATYTIPSYSFDIWQFAPALEEPVRWITTFLFVSAFFGSLYNMWWKAVIGVRDWDEFAVRELATDLGVDYE